MTATTDHLRTWLALRDQVPWHQARPIALPAPRPHRDGAAHDIRTHDHARDPRRAAHLLAALSRTRADAASDTPLSFQLLSSWQRLVLDTPEAPSFRVHPAYAKAGRERYDISPELPARLDACLREAEADDLPLTARAARAYLDVCFFHPFTDGNARSAFLTLTFLLARAGVTLDQVGPVRRLQRRADDPHGALALADLLALLIAGIRTTPSSHPHSSPAGRPPTCPPPH
ncbi:Fic family protein [Streptomyces cinnabarinus]|uniref:Fic family protein n=1 Tax=Streptomyces cinnabarinus TaxID=67287 RepID=A0ABY7KDG9_9ACTN|nr:Fic family protein [Streptomyces cinnabarinus]WAZ21402.1 Fic family protein [Streptomyces cinnabarinus]